MKENLVLIPCTIVGFNEPQTFKSGEKDIRYASLLVRVGTTIVKLKIKSESIDSVMAVAKNSLDKKVEIAAEISAGQNQSAEIKAVEIKGK